MYIAVSRASKNLYSLACMCVLMRKPSGVCI